MLSPTCFGRRSPSLLPSHLRYQGNIPQEPNPTLLVTLECTCLQHGIENVYLTSQIQRAYSSTQASPQAKYPIYPPYHKSSNPQDASQVPHPTVPQGVSQGSVTANIEYP